MAINILRARPEHSARLTQIAHAAKSYWGYPTHWIELWRNQLTITAAYIRDNEVYAAADEDDVLLGFHALTGTPPKMLLDHLWVQPQSFSGGVGRALFQHAAQRAVERGASSIEIEADPNAEGFYQKMGAETVGEVTYELEGMPRSLPLMLYVIGDRSAIFHAPGA